MSRPFAVFDIDGTLIRWQLYHAIVNELAKAGHLKPGAYEKIHTSRMVWKARTHSESFNEYTLALVEAYHQALTQLDVNEYLKVIDKVFDEYKDQVYTYTRDLLKSLKKQGYLLFAISGSQQEIIEKLAKHYGFDAAVGNVYERKNGKFTGKHAHIIENKPVLLSKLVKQFNTSYENSVGVGDSDSDIDFLATVEQPIAFNPSRGLLEYATKHNWQVVVERKNVVYKLFSKDGNYILA